MKIGRIKAQEAQNIILSFLRTFTAAGILCKSRLRPRSLVAIAAKHRSAHFGLKRNLILFAAMITDDLETRRSVLPRRRLFRTAFLAPLWGCHVSLVERLLLLFCKEKRLLTLHARSFDIRHRVLYSLPFVLRMRMIIPQPRTLTKESPGAQLGDVFLDGAAKGFQIVPAFHARNYSPVANFVGPLHKRPRHRSEIGILQLQLP